jgi:hypothetical protein
MIDRNALTDAAAMTIAVSFALQPAIGPGISGLLGLIALNKRSLAARWAAIVLGALFGIALGLIAWQGDGDMRWIAIGALAGVLAGAGEARLRNQGGREFAGDGAACQCQLRARRRD